MVFVKPVIELDISWRLEELSCRIDRSRIGTDSSEAE
jgi:hypothetical protein